MKGTRKGIEAILGMFGYVSGSDYEIKEYIAKCEKFPTYNEAVCARVEFDYVNSDENTNFMAGYPVALVEEGENDLILIPWYDKNEKYDYDFHFQGKGGWCKTKHKHINRKAFPVKERLFYLVEYILVPEPAGKVSGVYNKVGYLDIAVAA
jgi:hypothetical protein